MSKSDQKRRAIMGDYDELDRLCAEKIMGWGFSALGNDWLDLRQGFARHVDGWHPTRNIEQAFEVMQKFEGGYLLSGSGTHCDCLVKVGSYTHGDQFTALADTAPLAIVKACLRAKGVKV